MQVEILCHPPNTDTHTHKMVNEVRSLQSCTQGIMPMNAMYILSILLPEGLYVPYLWIVLHKFLRRQ